jgi:hypothetical protein
LGSRVASLFFNLVEVSLNGEVVSPPYAVFISDEFGGYQSLVNCDTS